jgi:hypothetical protein
MAYQDPRQVKSPKPAITHLKVLYDGGEQVDSGGEWSGWSVAGFEWFEVRVLGIRWNGSTENPDVSNIGNPQSRGIATWYVCPKPLEDTVRAMLEKAPTTTTEE